MRTVAYVRVSTEEQKLSGYSVEAQKMKLKQYAKDNELKIKKWYVDAGVSGRKKIKNRPALMEMINDRDTYDHIIFIKLDRFFRSVAEYHECMKLLDGKTWAATEEKYDLTTANGRMFVNMKLTIAELEADQTGERIKLVNEYKIKEGKPITQMPFYFDIVGDKGNKKIVLKNHDMIVDLIEHFTRYQSLQKSTQYINEKYDVNYQQQYYKIILKDTRLYGSYKGNPNYCPAHITKEQYDKVQTILPRQMKQNAKNIYLFKGLIKCQECGWRMSGFGASGRNGKHPAYMCSLYKNSRTCPNRHSYSENLIEKQLLEMIEPLIKEEKHNAIKAKEKKIDTRPIEDEMKRLTYSFQKGRINVDEYDRKYEELSDRLDKIKIAQKPDRTKDVERIEKIISSGWKEVYAALDREHKQAFWRNIISEIVLEWADEKPHTKVKSVKFIN